MNIDTIGREHNDAFIVLQPHSITNPGDDYLVVQVRVWLAAYNAGIRLTGGSYHKSYTEAANAADELNAYASLIPREASPAQAMIDAGETRAQRSRGDAW